MWKQFGNIYRQFVFALFAALGAKDSAKLPFLGTKRALQIPFPSVPLLPQDSEQGKGIAARATASGHQQSWGKHGGDDEFGIGLQKRACKKLLERIRGMLRVEVLAVGPLLQASLPECFECSGPRVGSLLFQIIGLGRERAWGVRFNNREKRGERLNQDGQIDFRAKRSIRRSYALLAP